MTKQLYSTDDLGVRVEACSTPIDGTAARVMRPAKAENVWMPQPKSQDRQYSRNILQVAKSPASFPKVIGKRRDRFVIVGYAAEQSKSQSKSKSARWVVRCDCGNYEVRTKILRWLGTAAPDMCVECRVRTYKTKGEWASREKAARTTVDKLNSESKDS